MTREAKTKAQYIEHCRVRARQTCVMFLCIFARTVYDFVHVLPLRIMVHTQRCELEQFIERIKTALLVRC